MEVIYEENLKRKGTKFKLSKRMNMPSGSRKKKNPI